MPSNFDKTDRLILSTLQEDARISNAELAERINLSPTPCLRRVKRLEEQGVIEGYSARLNKEKLGLGISAFVFIQLERNSSHNASAFEQAIQNLDAVIDCYVLTGEYDYLLNVVTPDLKGYEDFIKKRLADIPQVAKIDTTIILNQVMSKRSLPIPPSR